MRQVSAAQLAHFHVLQVVPNPFTGIQVRGRGRPWLSMKILGSSLRQERAHVPLMHGRAVPDHQQFVRDVRQQMPQKDHAIEAVQRFIMHQRVESAIPRDPTHHRQMITGIHRPQDGCLSAWCIGSDHPRHEIKSRLVHQDNGPAFDARLFLSSGHTWTRHGLMSTSSRWAARSIGIWGGQCRRFNNRETWALWYETPNSSQITVATRAQVQNSPRNPYASAPWDNSSGIKASWSGMSLTGPVGHGLARHASWPCARASATHWLTAAAETPKAAAISYCFQPA
jgi:hypothetical protein